MDKIAINRLVQFIDYIYQCPCTGEDWIRNFNTFFTQNKITEANCPECLDACLKRYNQKFLDKDQPEYALHINNS